jgi:hypothetical protein
MECGDLSPLWTGQFIGPPGTFCGGRGGEIHCRLSGSALEIAVKSGTKEAVSQPPKNAILAFFGGWQTIN